MKPKTVIVLGMGRSGTSPTADIQRRLGVNWGPEVLMMKPLPDNPLGFWEFIPFYEINVELLRRLGGDWHRPPNLTSGWERSKDLDYLRVRASNIIRRYFRAPMWGFKDPRCCLTLPFWETVISNPIECVIPIRNPLEVASSLYRREGLSISGGLSLWAKYVSWAWQASQKFRRIVVSYDLLLENTRSQILRLADFLGLKNSPEVIENAACVIHSGHKHQKADPQELSSNVEVSELVRGLYQELRKLSVDEAAEVDRFVKTSSSQESLRA